VYFSSKKCEWSTPPELFADLDAEFGPFTLDACATAENAKCAAFFTRSVDGLAQRWTGRVWLNPPYGRAICQWLRKALESVQSGDAKLVVCLVPVRVDTSWWHDHAVRGEVRFLRSRVRFGGAESGAPFPSAVVVFRNGCGVTKQMSEPFSVGGRPGEDTQENLMTRTGRSRNHSTPELDKTAGDGVG
jgi:site-specific DNA-methyltransferase (adenine-specific)